jgi:hypothetical protein
MGFDINGLRPFERTPKPLTIDFKSATREESSEYNNKMIEWYKDNPGGYLRLALGGWGPMVALMKLANRKYQLNIDMRNWECNDGYGLRNKEKCIKLAESLEDISCEIKNWLIRMGVHNDGLDDYKFGINRNSWERVDRIKITKNEEKKLIYRFASRTVTKYNYTINGIEYITSNAMNLRTINILITFLKECGGFSIW